MRTPLLAATALLLALAATSCGDDEPSAEPTPKMPSPTSSSTTSTPTAEPEPWEVQSPAGVKAFLQRYVEIFSEALATGDTETYRALTTDCDGCDEVAAQVEEVYGAGGTIRTDFLEFANWSIGEKGIGDRVSSTVAYRSPPVTWVRSAGAEPETYPGGKTEKIVILTWKGERWLIADLLPVEP